MILRQLGLGVQELEAGPLTVLLSHSLPVAYRDTRSTAPAPGLYRSDRYFSKATTRHVNTWTKGQVYSTVPHDLIVAAFQSISRFTTLHPKREKIGGLA